MNAAVGTRQASPEAVPRKWIALALATRSARSSADVRSSGQVCSDLPELLPISSLPEARIRSQTETGRSSVSIGSHVSANATLELVFDCVLSRGRQVCMNSIFGWASHRSELGFDH